MAFLAFAGCVEPAQTVEPTSNDGVPTAAELLAAYHPKPIRLVEINVTAEVSEPFMDEYLRQASRETATYQIRPGANGSVLVSNNGRALWLVQDNDTVILGTYHLKSNKHDIIDQQLAISSTTTARLFLGGLDFRVVTSGGSFAHVFTGGWVSSGRTQGAYFPFDLPAPIPQATHFNHTSTFPMSVDAHHVAFEVRNVTAVATIRNHRLATFELAESTMLELEEEPDYVDEMIAQNRADFYPGARLGQYSARCGEPLKVPAPCMNPWEHPQT